MADQAQFCGSCGAKAGATSLVTGLLSMEPPRKSIPPSILGGVTALLLAGGLFGAYSYGKKGEAESGAANAVTAPANPSVAVVAAKPAVQQIVVQVPVSEARFNFGKYAETYPFNGFMTDPQVLSMMRAAVPNRQLLNEMDSRSGPQTPIKVGGKYLIAFGCEAHNCGGGYNWSVVLVDAKAGQFARICIHDSARMGDFSEWYQNGRLKNRVIGECPSELAGVY